jgi:hypothetical protein
LCPEVLGQTSDAEQLAQKHGHEGTVAWNP